MRRLALPSLVLCVALAVPAPVAAWCRMTTDLTAACIIPDPSADPPSFYLGWQRPCTTIAISDLAPSRDLEPAEVRSALERSITTWESVTCDGVPLGIDMSVRAEATSCVTPYYRNSGGNANTLIFSPVWDRDYMPGAFALTTVWHRPSTGEILDVDIEINEDRGPYGRCPDAGCTDERMVDLENVLAHELGHYLGVAHSTEVGTTMFQSALAGEIHKRDLAPDDIEGVCAAYPAGFPAGECDTTPRGGLRLDCESGGCSVSRPGQARRGPGPRPFALVLVAAVLIGVRQRSSARRATS